MVSGKGKTVVVVHGWGDNSKSFINMQKSLAESYQVIILDLPGFGSSSLPESGWNLEDYSNFIKDFIDKLKVNVYAYIGHSNGGAILINGLSRRVISSEKLVLIASSGIRDTAKLKKKLILLGAKVGKVPLKLFPSEYQLKLKKRLYQAIKSDAAVNPQMIDTFKKIVKQDVSEDASKLHVSTLLIYGGNDKITPPEFGQIYNKLIKDSHLEVIEGAGHFVHLQEVDRVQKNIEDFLK
jgi:pimeloyl-ACP methyl ester carboxylesterase